MTDPRHMGFVTAAVTLVGALEVFAAGTAWVAAAVMLGGLATTLSESTT